MSDETAAYCLVFTGEGVSIVRLADGFAEAIDIVRHEIWMDGEADLAEWAEWVEQLNDESQWEHHEGREYRYRFDTDLGETGSLTIYRVESPHVIERLRAEVERLKAEFAKVCEQQSLVRCNGCGEYIFHTDIADEEKGYCWGCQDDIDDNGEIDPEYRVEAGGEA